MSYSCFFFSCFLYLHTHTQQELAHFPPCCHDSPWGKYTNYYCTLPSLACKSKAARIEILVTITKKKKGSTLDFAELNTRSWNANLTRRRVKWWQSPFCPSQSLASHYRTEGLCSSLPRGSSPLSFSGRKSYCWHLDWESCSKAGNRQSHHTHTDCRSSFVDSSHPWGIMLGRGSTQ